MTQKSLLPIPIEGESKVDLFQKREMRKLFLEGEWWFSVKDILEALVETPDGTRYARSLRDSDENLKIRWSEITRTVPIKAGVTVQNATFINIEGIFRLIQSVPSKKAEPFKKWLAKVAFERLQEIQNPELAVKRAIALYQAKGYDNEWIEARIRNKASRELLVAEWHKRGMKEWIGVLTDAVSVGTFGVSTRQHKEIKGLKAQQSLRDNMTPIELTLTTLGEQATQEITKSTNPQDLTQHHNAARQGGSIAGAARQKIEYLTNKKVVSSENYLTSEQRIKNFEKNKSINNIFQNLLELPPK
jgi:prophage antirepressor-like protein